jgi:hypothetical protein
VVGIVRMSAKAEEQRKEEWKKGKKDPPDGK